MYNALFSSNHFDQGMALICGTGMVAFGINNHQAHKAGGWGYYEGELGSAYHLGREAIRACIRAYDNRYEKTEFSKAIAKAIGLEKATDIIKVSNDFHDQRTKTASLAPIVTRYANIGDHKAMAICNKAIGELVLAIKAVYETLRFDDVNLVIIGSLGHAKGYFHETLLKSIQEFNKKIHVIDPVIDPALGAAKAAKIYSEEF
jgi:N-acetylglucosamine kinase-like BadF-type ATPase